MSEMNPSAETRMAAEFLLMRMRLDKEAATSLIDIVLDNPNGPGAPSIVSGLLNVGTALVWMLAEARGALMEDDKMTMARDILRHLTDDVAQ